MILVALLFLLGACDKSKVVVNEITGDITIDAGWSLIEISTNLDELAPDIVASLTDEEVEKTGLERLYIRSLLVSLGQLLETLELCERDDVYTFEEPSQSLIFDNNNSPCDANMPADNDSLFSGDMTWELNGNILTIQDSLGTYVFSVITLTDDQLVIESILQYEDQDLGIIYTGESVKTTITFAAN